MHPIDNPEVTLVDVFFYQLLEKIFAIEKEEDIDDELANNLIFHAVSVLVFNSDSFDEVQEKALEMFDLHYNQFYEESDGVIPKRKKK